MRLIDGDAVLEFMRDRLDMQELYLPIHFKEFVVDEMPTVSPKQGQWYAVAKEMPEPGDWGVGVLVYTVDHEYHVWTAMPYRADNYCWEDGEGYCHDKWEAELWMPLPEV